MTRRYLALDVGEKRIGVAFATDDVKISVPRGFILVDGSEIDQIKKMITDENIDLLVVGYPRNQQGEATKQTQFVKKFVEKLGSLLCDIVYQDESLTSVKAENILDSQKRPYEKGEVDSLAASFILQDFLEMQ